MINKPITVLAQFSDDGRVNPLRFKIETEDGRESVQIDSSLLKVNNNIRMEFICDITLNGVRHKCEIWFFKQDTRWILCNLK